MLRGQIRIHLTYDASSSQLDFLIGSLYLIIHDGIINDLNFASISGYLYNFHIYILDWFVAILNSRINIWDHRFIPSFCEWKVFYG